MELIKISEGKLKIMLTPPDMEKYHLNSSELDCKDGYTREAFKHIFDDARTQVNFNTEGDRLFIQLYTSRGGGCEIFVTKIDSSNQPKTDTPPITNKERELLDRICTKKENHPERQGHVMNISSREKEDNTSSPPKPRLRPFVFAFDGLQPLLSVCKLLDTMGFDADSRAYIDTCDTTYLVLSLPSGAFYRLPDRYAFIAEFGRRIMSDGVDFHLEEHTRTLCNENAVALLAKC